MTMWARAGRCLVLFVVLATGAVSLTVGGAARVATAAPQDLCTTAANPATFTYDAPTIARDDVRGLEGIEAPAALLCEARDESASSSVGARGTATTLSARSVATEAVPGIIGTPQTAEGQFWAGQNLSTPLRQLLWHAWHSGGAR